MGCRGRPPKVSVEEKSTSRVGSDGKFGGSGEDVSGVPLEMEFMKELRLKTSGELGSEAGEGEMCGDLANSGKG
ncbi:hypothetical protein Dimus_036348, partial [Dionaea muscipula]